MKFNELTIRELRAQVTAACLKVIHELPEDKRAKYDFLHIDYIEPDAMEEDDDNEYFTVLGSISLDEGTNVPFKANLVWLGDMGCCDFAGPEDNVEFLDKAIEDLLS